jgi:hypothetical protein
MHRVFFLVVWAAACLASAAPAADPLPAFLGKVQLWNFDGYEPTPDGTGVSVYRLPAEIRAALSEAGAPSRPRRSPHTARRACVV